MGKNGDVFCEDFRKDEDIDKGYFPEGTVHEDVFFSLGELRFVWDKAKSDRCYAERGFDFRTAAMIFNDDACITEPDPIHSIDEERYITIGMIDQIAVVLMVVYTMREEEATIRIISARKATKSEREAYFYVNR